MSIVSLFPDTSKSGNTDQEAFEREVAARFGLVPNFFRSAPEAPLVVRELWLFAKSAYLDTPIPTLFKERLFVYLYTVTLSARRVPIDDTRGPIGAKRRYASEPA